MNNEYPDIVGYLSQSYDANFQNFELCKNVIG